MVFVVFGVFMIGLLLSLALFAFVFMSSVSLNACELGSKATEV